jgi:hypothetical protein
MALAVASPSRHQNHGFIDGCMLGVLHDGSVRSMGKDNVALLVFNSERLKSAMRTSRQPPMIRCDDLRTVHATDEITRFAIVTILVTDGFL